MPVVGYVNPEGKEQMPDPSFQVPWMTREELLEWTAEQELGESHWTYEMVAGAMDNIQERGDMISSTALGSGCPRAEIIKRREDYVVDLNEMYAALRGTLMHRTMELWTPPLAIPEVRFFMHVDGIEISCKPDQITPGELVDYKVPSKQSSVPMSYLYNNQTEQLMTNAFIVRHAERWDPEGTLAFDPREHPAKVVGIVFVGPERPKVMVYKRSETFTGPSGKSRKLRVPYVWSDDETLKVIRPRLHMLHNALKSYPDWPEPWENPETGEVVRAEELWGGHQDWTCPGYPICKFQTCLAKRDPEMYAWAR